MSMAKILPFRAINKTNSGYAAEIGVAIDVGSPENWRWGADMSAPWPGPRPILRDFETYQVPSIVTHYVTR